MKTLVVGCGNMGRSHALAYHRLPDFEIVGVVSRKPESRLRLAAELGGVPDFESFETALKATRPDVVSINTYPETHASFAAMSLQAGAHVFVEKPLATTVREAEQLVEMAHRQGKKMVVGYILRVHPTWQKFIDLAQTLGSPLVMRMNLNQQSSATTWYTHRQLMKTMSPIVDCGVHYLDVMCLMTKSKPVRVSAIGANLTTEIAPTMYNYGQLQVVFENGSVGWYEAGWGPMMSETAFFIKDVIGPKGAVSMIDPPKAGSDDIEGHTKSGGLRLHHSILNDLGQFAKSDEWFATASEPSHDELCELEQRFFLRAIQEDLDLSQHLADAVNSLKIVLAADESVRTGRMVWVV